ncbi:MAG: hypothetical protein MPEBLZ_02050 [Candidatus Methanoperedens nitroreducens]|uniref:Uncharacterized protein n=1 Tax=Candidatus Methanoperedens nitratireducens TaxID=1392998 RepID=A0A0P8A9T0_9EURY|nr:MAG: hypothetical protein MPEBLZ_02050 [Candidatus Methanoperedens sp. BLZ1]
MNKKAIYRYGKTELLEGSQIPRNAIVEFIGMATRCRKQKKYAIRYNGVVYFTSYGKLDFRVPTTSHHQREL